MGKVKNTSSLTRLIENQFSATPVLSPNLDNLDVLMTIPTLRSFTPNNYKQKLLTTNQY